MSSDELLEFLNEQIKLEHEIVGSLERPLEHIKNPAVKSVLKAISLDSVKHAVTYESVIKLLMSPHYLSRRKTWMNREL